MAYKYAYFRGRVLALGQPIQEHLGSVVSLLLQLTVCRCGSVIDGYREFFYLPSAQACVAQHAHNHRWRT